MMKKSTFFLMFLLSVFMIACNESSIDDTLGNVPDSDMRTITVTASMNGDGSKMSVDPQDEAWSLEFQVDDKLYGWGNQGTLAEFSVVSVNSGTGFATITGTFTPAQNENSMRLLYPYDTGREDSTEQVISVAEQSIDMADDAHTSFVNGDSFYLLSDSFDISDTDSEETLSTTMKHLLSYLEMEIVAENADTLDCVVESITITGLSSATKLSFEDGELAESYAGDTETITIDVANATKLVNGESMIIPFSIIPFAADGTEEISVKLNFTGAYLESKSIEKDGAAIETFVFNAGEFNTITAHFDVNDVVKVTQKTLADFNASNYIVPTVNEDADTTYEYVIGYVPEESVWEITDTASASSGYMYTGLALAIKNYYETYNIAPTIKFIDSGFTSIVINALYYLWDNTNTTVYSSGTTIATGYLADIQFYIEGEYITNLSNYCFWSCSGLLGFKGSTTTMSLGQGSFRNCSLLTEDKLEVSAATNLDKYGVFIGCSSFKDLYLPNVTTANGNNTFQSCTNMETLSLPKLTSIGYTNTNTFNGCTSLETLTFGTESTTGVTYIYEGVISGCSTATTDITLNIMVGADANFYVDGNTICFPQSGDGVADNVYTFAQINATEPIAELTLSQFAVNTSLDAADFFLPSGTEWKIMDDNSDGLLTSSDFDGLCYAIAKANGYTDDMTSTTATKLNSTTATTIPNISFPNILEIPESAFCRSTSTSSTASNVPAWSHLNYTISMPSATKLGASAFLSNRKLSSVDCEQVTEIGANTFYYCENMATLNMPKLVSTGASGLRKISSTSGLKSAKFDYLTTIGNNTFSDSYNLGTVELSALKSVSVNSLFYFCTAMTSIKLPMVTSITGTSTFQRNDKLTSLEIGTGSETGVTNILEATFQNIGTMGDDETNTSVLAALTLTIKTHPTECNFTVDDSAHTLSFPQEGEEPDTVYQFKEIIWTVGEVVEPESYTLADFASYDASSTTYPTATEWVITDENTEADLTFVDFRGLLYAIDAANDDGHNPTIKLENLLTLPTNAFYNQGTQTVDETSYAVVNNQLIYSVELPKATSIGEGAFWSNYKLVSVKAPLATTIGANAFRNCEAATTIDIESATSLGAQCFRNLKKVTSLSLEKVTGLIYGSTFNATNALKSLSLPLVEEVSGSSTFDSMLAATSLYLPMVGAISNDSQQIYNCESLTSITLGTTNPSGITTIKETTFKTVGSAVLTNITLDIKVGLDANFYVDGNFLCFPQDDVDGQPVDDTKYEFKLINCENLADSILSMSDFAAHVSAGTYPTLEVWNIYDDTVTAGDDSVAALISTINKANDSGVYPPVNFMNLTAVPADLFSGVSGTSTAIFSVELPVATTIGAGAFDGCSALTSISMPMASAVEGTTLFNNCTALTSIAIGTETTDGVLTLSESLFESANLGSTLLTNITLDIKAAALANFYVTKAAEAGETDPYTLLCFSDNSYLTDENFDFTNYTNGADNSYAFKEINYEYVMSSQSSFTLSDFQYYTYRNENYPTTATTWTITDTNENEDLTALDFDGLQYAIKAANVDGIEPEIVFSNIQTLTDRSFFNNSGESPSDGSISKTLLFSVKLSVATEIGEGAFWSCNKLKSVVASNATTLGENAFRNCNAANPITFGDVTALKAATFWGANAVTTLNLGSVAGTIYGNTFNTAKALTSISMPLVTGVSGADVFDTCNALTEIYLPMATSIVDTNGSSSSTFIYNCSNLKTLTFGTLSEDGVSTLTESIFSGNLNNTVLTNITLNIKVAEDANFYVDGNYLKFPQAEDDATSYELKEINATVVEKVGYDMADFTTYVSSSTYPSEDIWQIRDQSITAGGQSVIDLIATIAAANTTASKYPTIEFLNLTEVPEDLFSGVSGTSTAIFSVELPVAETIGAGAFDGCSALTSISMPVASAVEGTTLFKDCTALTSIEIGSETTDGVLTLSESLFESANLGTTVLTNITLDIKVAALANFYVTKAAEAQDGDPYTLLCFGDNSYAFKEINYEYVMSSQSSFTLSDFQYYSAANQNYPTTAATWTITDVNSEDSLLEGDFDGLQYAIKAANSASLNPLIDFTELKTLPLNAFANKATSGDAYSYVDASLIFSIELDKATYIGVQAFIGCKAVTSIKAPLVEEIGNNAFQNCEVATTIDVSSVKTLGTGAFYSAYEVKELSLDNVTNTIGQNTFNGVQAATTLSLPLVTAIDGKDVFDVCKAVEEIDLPLVTSINAGSSSSGSGFFYNCNALTTLNIGNKSVTGVTSLSESMFQSTYLNNTVLTGVTLNIKVADGANFAVEKANEIDDDYTVLSFTDGADYTFKKIVHEVVEPVKTEFALADFASMEDASDLPTMQTWTITDTEIADNIGETDLFAGLKSAITLANGLTDGSYSPKVVFTEIDRVPSYAFYFGSANFDTATFSVVLSKATTIGTYAFYNVKEMSAITADAVIEVEDRGMYYCSALTEIRLPSATTFGPLSLRFCQGASTIYLPRAESLGNNMLANSKSGATTLDLGSLGNGVNLAGSANALAMANTASCTLTIKINRDNNYAKYAVDTDANTVSYYICASDEDTYSGDRTTQTFSSITDVTDYTGNLYDYSWDYSATKYPTDTATWSIKDSNIINASEYEGIEAALAAYTSGSPMVEMSNITSIVDSAFSGCTALKILSLPMVTTYTPASLDVSPINGCTGLTELHFGSSDNYVTSINEYLFDTSTVSGITLTLFYDPSDVGNDFDVDMVNNKLTVGESTELTFADIDVNL